MFIWYRFPCACLSCFKFDNDEKNYIKKYEYTVAFTFQSCAIFQALFKIIDCRP